MLDMCKSSVASPFIEKLDSKAIKTALARFYRFSKGMGIALEFAYDTNDIDNASKDMREFCKFFSEDNEKELAYLDSVTQGKLGDIQGFLRSMGLIYNEIQSNISNLKNITHEIDKLYSMDNMDLRKKTMEYFDDMILAGGDKHYLPSVHTMAMLIDKVGWTPNKNTLSQYPMKILYPLSQALPLIMEMDRRLLPQTLDRMKRNRKLLALLDEVIDDIYRRTMI